LIFLHRVLPPERRQNNPPRQWYPQPAPGRLEYSIVIPGSVPSKWQECLPDKSVTWMLWASERPHSHGSRPSSNRGQHRGGGIAPLATWRGDQHASKVANISWNRVKDLSKVASFSSKMVIARNHGKDHSFVFLLDFTNTFHLAQILTLFGDVLNRLSW